MIRVYDDADLASRWAPTLASSAAVGGALRMPPPESPCSCLLALRASFFSALPFFLPAQPASINLPGPLVIMRTETGSKF